MCRDQQSQPPALHHPPNGGCTRVREATSRTTKGETLQQGQGRTSGPHWVPGGERAPKGPAGAVNLRPWGGHCSHQGQRSSLGSPAPSPAQTPYSCHPILNTEKGRDRGCPLPGMEHGLGTATAHSLQLVRMPRPKVHTSLGVDLSSERLRGYIMSDTNLPASKTTVAELSLQRWPRPGMM